LNDPTIVNLGNIKAIIMHGDTLCIDDTDYLKFRSLVRSKAWISNFLKKSIGERLEIYNNLKIQSENEKKIKSDSIMDVNNTAVEDIFRKNNYPSYLIHGHTHRLKTHDYLIENHFTQRWVLGDWHRTGNYILWENNQLKSVLLNEL